MKLRMLLLIISYLIAACSSAKNDEAPTTTNAHEPVWITKHDQKAQQDLVGCQVCHEANFSGNVPAPGCLECHFSGPPFFIHPPLREANLGWAHPSNHGSWAKDDIKKCKGCHSGLGGGAGSNPRFIRPLGKLEMGCESAPGCHNNNDSLNSFTNGHNLRAAHPTFDPAIASKQDQKHWYGESIVYQTSDGKLNYYRLNHSTAGNLSVACALCHGANLKGPAEGGVGPACMDCHVLDPVANPTRCVSCHGPLPGVQRSVLMKPALLAEAAGRTDLQGKLTHRTFVSELTNRMRRDPSYIKINPENPHSTFYFGSSKYIDYSSVTNLSSRSTHLNHDTVACEERKSNATCNGCHTANAASNALVHHRLMSPRGIACLNCHEFELINGSQSFKSFRNCRDCHTEFFCN